MEKLKLAFPPGRTAFGWCSSVWRFCFVLVYNVCDGVGGYGNHENKNLPSLAVARKKKYSGFH